MKKRVFIIHGWEGTPDSNWFPWLKGELEKNDFEVMVPQMPNADLPKETEWTAYLQEIIGDTDENTFLIGHSLGAIAILRYLETLEENLEIGGAILVSGFSESLGIFPEIENFFKNPVNYENIKSHCKNFIAINSDDDPLVPLEKGNILRDKLDAKLIVLQNMEHIQEPELPVALEELLRISR
jgi:uncharacterized protein